MNLDQFLGRGLAGGLDPVEIDPGGDRLTALVVAVPEHELAPPFHTPVEEITDQTQFECPFRGATGAPVDAFHKRMSFSFWPPVATREPSGLKAIAGV